MFQGRSGDGKEVKPYEEAGAQLSVSRERTVVTVY